MPVKPQNGKLRVAGQGVGNTRARRTNTAKRAPNMPMLHCHVPMHVSASETSTTTNYELHAGDGLNKKRHTVHHILFQY